MIHAVNAKEVNLSLINGKSRFSLYFLKYVDYIFGFKSNYYSYHVCALEYQPHEVSVSFYIYLKCVFADV